MVARCHVPSRQGSSIVCVIRTWRWEDDLLWAHMKVFRTWTSRRVGCIARSRSCEVDVISLTLTENLTLQKHCKKIYIMSEISFLWPRLFTRMQLSIYIFFSFIVWHILLTKRSARIPNNKYKITNINFKTYKGCAKSYYYNNKQFVLFTLCNNITYNSYLKAMV